MTTIDQIPTRDVDPDKLMSFVFQAVGEVGAALNTALVVLGDALGYYTTMADGEPLTPAALAERTGTAEPYAREWLSAQAAGGYVEYDAPTRTYTLPPEQAVALADPTSPAYLPGFFQIAHGTVRDTPAVLGAARTGDGIGWHAHNTDVHHGCERFFRSMYNGHLLGEWLPALDGVVGKLERGARVADVGCGHGASTILMARAYPDSTFVGSDYHEASVEIARQRAREAGVADRVDLRGGLGDGVPRLRLRPRDDVRLPARHGRPGRSRRARARGDRGRRHVDGGRADGRRPRGGQPHPGRAGRSTASPRCSAPRRRCRRTSASPSVPRRARPGSGTSRWPAASPAASVPPRRPRSTTCSRSVREDVRG